MPVHASGSFFPKFPMERAETPVGTCCEIETKSGGEADTEAAGDVQLDRGEGCGLGLSGGGDLGGIGEAMTSSRPSLALP